MSGREGYTDGYGWVDGPQPVIVETLNELDWLREVVEGAHMTMADVLHEHQDSQAANGGRNCICGEWEGPWTGNGFAAHQAAALSAAGFGPVQDAKAQALREAAEALLNVNEHESRMPGIRLSAGFLAGREASIQGQW